MITYALIIGTLIAAFLGLKIGWAIVILLTILIKTQL